MKYRILFLAASLVISSQSSSKSIPVKSSSVISTANLKGLLVKDAKKLAEYYRQRVLKGESMSSIAQLYSEDPGSASNGGQYRHVVRGMMVKEFEQVAFSLKPGELSEVFETQYGFHFIQLISRKGDTLDLRHVLIMKD